MTVLALSANPAECRKIPQSAAPPPTEPQDSLRFVPDQRKEAQLIYVKSGVLRVTTFSGLWTVPPATAVWIPPEMPHAIRRVGAVTMRAVAVEPHLAAELWPECRVIQVAGLLRALVLQMLDEPVGHESTERGKLMTGLILHELKGAASMPLQIPIPHEPRVLKICEALIARPESKDTLEAWAAHAGTSARTVARLFKDETGLSFGAWRQHLRLGEALCRLVAGQGVAEVASRLGYRSASAFIAMFRRALGDTPHRYLHSQHR